jgi:hypothetical protein
MLPESAIRQSVLDPGENALTFWELRRVAVRAQANEYRRHYAEIGQPVDTEPVTLTGDDWRNAVDTEIDAVLELIY